MEKLSLNAEEMGLIEIALESTIEGLRQRFEEEAQYVHPAKQYEELHKKLVQWMDPLPACNYSISAEKIV
jgi:hypothetical protein